MFDLKTLTDDCISFKPKDDLERVLSLALAHRKQPALGARCHHERRQGPQPYRQWREKPRPAAPHGPHLNPIERLWAVMHSHVTHNRHYPTQKHFANAILNFMREVVPKQWRNFRDQVTDNFRVISHRNVRVLQ
jgi:transposase